MKRKAVLGAMLTLMIAGMFPLTTDTGSEYGTPNSYDNEQSEVVTTSFTSGMRARMVSKSHSSFPHNTMEASQEINFTVNEDWPMFHHDPSRTGHSQSKAPKTNSTLWIYTIDSSTIWWYEGPSIADGMVFIGHTDGVDALDFITGELVWSYNTPDYVSSTPAIADGMVFFGCMDNNVYALNETTGDEIWTFEWEAIELFWNSPAVADGMVFIGCSDGNLYALDQKTGDMVWNYTTGGVVYGLPAVADGMVFFYGDGRVYALNETTGETIWTNYMFDYPFYTSPAIADGMVFVHGSMSRLFALNETTGETIWTSSFRGAGHGSSPAVADGLVFIGANVYEGHRYRVFALNETTGDIVWSYNTGDRMESSPAVADGLVFIESEDGNLYALNATTGDLVWSYMIGGWGDYPPAVAHGLVFAVGGSQCNQIYCFGTTSNVTVSPNGGRIFVDGDPVVAQKTYTWPKGAFHVLDPDSGFFASNGTRLMFDQWSDGNTSDPRTILVDGDSTFTAEWSAQYHLTVDTEPSGLSPQPVVSPPGPWYHNGTRVNCTAEEIIEQYAFDHWAIDGMNQGKGVNPIAVDMDKPHAVTATYLIHDVAVIDVFPSETEVYEGNIVDINVTVKNQGNISETFDVIAFYDSNIIQTQTNIALDADTETTLTFNWNTSGVPGNHRISAEAINVAGEVDTSDNVFVNGIIEVIAKTDIPIPGAGNATIEGNVTITKTVVKKNALHFDASGPSGSTGWINVTLPMINTTEIKVFINKEKLTPPPFPIVTTNGTHYFIYFEFTLSTHEITIQYATVDIAITSVTSSKTIVGQGYNVSIYATVENQGDYAETFNVTIFANATEIATQNINLEAGNSTFVTVMWKTPCCVKGNFMISANVTVVAGETHTADNHYVGGTVMVTMPGDVAPAYGLVDIVDVVKCALGFGSRRGDPEYDPDCDINDDGIIDIVDIVIIAIHFGETDP